MSMKVGNGETFEMIVQFGELNQLENGEIYELPNVFYEGVPVSIHIRKNIYDDGDRVGYSFGLKAQVPTSYKHIKILHEISIFNYENGRKNTIRSTANSFDNYQR